MYVFYRNMEFKIFDTTHLIQNLGSYMYMYKNVCHTKMYKLYITYEISCDTVNTTLSISIHIVGNCTI